MKTHRKFLGVLLAVLILLGGAAVAGRDAIGVVLAYGVDGLSALGAGIEPSSMASLAELGITPDEYARLNITDEKLADRLAGYSLLEEGKAKVLTVDQNLPDAVRASFEGGVYWTIETLDEVYVCRYFGGTAKAAGAFATTLRSSDKVLLADRLALLPEWGNTLDSVAVIVIPEGTVLQIGLVARQVSENDVEYKGGAEQILMPLNWPAEWIRSVWIVE